jgi:hypothetical protein
MQQTITTPQTVNQAAELHRQLHIHQALYNSAAKFSTKVYHWKYVQAAKKGLAKLQSGLLTRAAAALIIVACLSSCAATKRDCQGVKHTRLSNGIWL